MRRLPRVLVSRLSYILAIGLSLEGCQHVNGVGGNSETYQASDIDVDRGTLKGAEISAFVDVEVRLRGLVKSSSKGSTIMYLTRDKTALDADSHRNCMNLIIDRRLKFRSPHVSEYTFRGEFVLIDRIDPSIVHLTYKGIGFSTDCQALKRSDRYPYFFVKHVER